ncbi:3-oxoacyl-reductase [Pyrenochaeta sp. MPI-SDFR-AT-0127]|nr:3-oxoacyl-reductase [Pyrenochaeta sp. MPI-SDFR-AT-0127]
MTLFNGRVIAITGAASGIGLATAHLLASRNATLSIADVNSVALEEAEKALKQRFPSVEILPYVLNVSKEEEVQKWIETIVNVYGRLDGAANLAGVIGKSIGIRGIDQQDMAEWDFIMNVNLKGVMLCLKYQLQHMSDKGAIVNASSIAGVQGMANNAAYTASKHGVIGLTRSAAKEAGHRGVRVNAICPGYIDTPMNHKSRDIAVANGGKEERNKKITSVALRRSGQPEECAELIAYLLGDGASFITGNAVSVDGGWNC